jgi:hypothetical protein
MSSTRPQLLRPLDENSGAGIEAVLARDKIGQPEPFGTRGEGFLARGS